MASTPNAQLSDPALTNVEKTVSKINENLNPFSKDASNNHSTGARALIRIGGKSFGVCQNLTWQISHNATPIFTLDSINAWDIDIGSLSVTMNLTSIINPTKGPEVDSILLGNMKSAVHAPFVDVQIIDRKTGTNIFFARGVFNSISGGVSRGQMGIYNAQFIGIIAQNYVDQSFEPFSSTASSLDGFTNALKGLSSLSGGIL